MYPDESFVVNLSQRNPMDKLNNSQSTFNIKNLNSQLFNSQISVNKSNNNDKNSLQPNEYEESFITFDRFINEVEGHKSQQSNKNSVINNASNLNASYLSFGKESLFGGN